MTTRLALPRVAITVDDDIVVTDELAVDEAGSEEDVESVRVLANTDTYFSGLLSTSPIWDTLIAELLEETGGDEFFALSIGNDNWDNKKS